MLTGPVEGTLLQMLVQLSGVRRVLEIGTYTGYAVQGRTSAAGAGMRESGQGKLPALLRGGVTAPQARRVAGCRRCAGMHKCREVQGCAGATNTLWSGKVLAPKAKPDHAIVAFNTRVTHDPRVEHLLLAVRDGVMLVRKR